MSREPNWLIHCISNNVPCECCGKTETVFPDGIMDAHTHGLEKFGHPELQLVIGYSDPYLICYILNTLAAMVEDGQKFTDGQLVEGIFEDCPVRMDLNKDCEDVEVFRVVIPDRNNRFPEEEKCEYPYTMQVLETKNLYLDVKA